MTVKTKLVRRCELTASCRREMITSRLSPRCPQIETKEPSWLPQMSGDSGGPSRLFLPSRTTHPTTGQSPLTALSPSGPEAQPSLPAAPRPPGRVGALPASLPQRHPPAPPWCSSECVALLSPRLPEARGAGQGDSWTLGGLGPWEDPSNQAVGPWRVGVVHGAWAGPGICILSRCFRTTLRSPVGCTAEILRPRQRQRQKSRLRAPHPHGR